MGNACECEGTNENEVLHGVVRPPPDDVVQAVGAAAAMKEKAYDLNVAPEIVKLRGTWKTENDGQTMGKIEGSEVVWDSLFNYSRSPLRLVGPRLIEMELMGQVHQAEVVESDVLRLVWSDGEIWARQRY
mmetsp:Transcript_59189/g.170010  ORF Transcript_59189/g.170010 Transcript_59189/m.170010 type:complete len:130 (-) Transcript_59189:118-507(-)